jgi:hypothetical protein
MATSPSNRSVSQAPQSLRKVRFPSLRKELLRLESGRLFAGVSVGEPWRRSVKFWRSLERSSPRSRVVKRSQRARTSISTVWWRSVRHAMRKPMPPTRGRLVITPPLCAPRNPGTACPLSGDNPTRGGAPRYHVSAPSLTRFGRSPTRSPCNLLRSRRFLRWPTPCCCPRLDRTPRSWLGVGGGGIATWRGPHSLRGGA